ncbi:hypothetical protein RFI_30684 [Reticulomyxa filosa]|uniref:Uncharacterized protein n=1 Tax=Reticulomyxa filosa TaxID=46433 RepID=X6LXN3_RETFI|nr:hypothetical protein RFI_30684 [Reticulomyxa filosa]|eukprot:ETO06708.1 hypothetical protein RFI_30684 [Reticulomyxa filosa]
MELEKSGKIEVPGDTRFYALQVNNVLQSNSSIDEIYILLSTSMKVDPLNDPNAVTIYLFVSSVKEPSPSWLLNNTNSTDQFEGYRVPLVGANVEVALTRKTLGQAFCANNASEQSPTSCIYFIAVHSSQGSTRSLSKALEYTLTASSNKDLVLLTHGVPQYGTIPATSRSGWRYYQFNVDRTNGALELGLTTLLGDLDIFVRSYFVLRGIDVLVNSTNWDYKSNSVNHDALAVPIGDTSQFVIGLWCTTISFGEGCEFSLTATEWQTSYNITQIGDAEAVFMEEAHLYDLEISFTANFSKQNVSLDLSCLFEVHVGSISFFVNNNQLPSPSESWLYESDGLLPYQPEYYLVRDIANTNISRLLIAVQGQMDGTLYGVTCDYIQTTSTISVGHSQQSVLMYDQYNYYMFHAVSDDLQINSSDVYGDLFTKLYISVQSLSALITSAPWMYLSKDIQRPTSDWNTYSQCESQVNLFAS